MKFTVEICTDNAAFEDYCGEFEQVANQVRSATMAIMLNNETNIRLHDTNGNTVGHIELLKEPEIVQLTDRELIKGTKHLIGSGLFSKVYQRTPEQVLIISDDYAKECMSLDWFPDSPLFPTLERVDNVTDDSAYCMKFYPDMKSRAVLPGLDSHNKALYQALRKISSVGAKDHELLDSLRRQFKALPARFAEEVEALLEAVNAMTNYGQDVCFEISPRNVATENGKLVLVDCFFIQSQVMSKRKAY